MMYIVFIIDHIHNLMNDFKMLTFLHILVTEGCTNEWLQEPGDFWSLRLTCWSPTQRIEERTRKYKLIHLKVRNFASSHIVAWSTRNASQLVSNSFFTSKFCNNTTVSCNRGGARDQAFKAPLSCIIMQHYPQSSSHQRETVRGSYFEAM